MEKDELINIKDFFQVIKYCLTLTFEALSEEPVQQGPTIVTEGWRHVVVHLEPVRNVDIETFTQHLKVQHTNTS